MKLAKARAFAIFRSIQGFLRGRGFVLLRSHYYLPIPDASDLPFERNSEMVGVAIDKEAQLRFLRTTVVPFKPELASMPMADESAPFSWVNGTFMAGDANVYYALVRTLKPGRIIEIGSGYSSAIADAALSRNKREDPDYACRFVCIDPYPPPKLSRLANVTRIEAKKVQEVDLSVFEELGSGDILFLDSAHVLRSGGDVWWEYCEILPRLSPGVWVHVHDISLPKPYPRVYFDNDLFWNEQYLLQAYLTNNARVEIVWAGTYAYTHFPEEVARAFSPEFEAMRRTFPLAEPSSFWFRVRQARPG